MGLIILFSNCFPSSLSANPFKIEDELDLTMQNGFHELFNLKFQEAKEIFLPLQDKSQEHPLLALALATVYWWEISVDVLETDPKASEPFLAAAQDCQKICLAKIKSGDDTGEAHLAMGTIYALMARWQASNHQWMSLFNSEKRARYYLTECLKINPEALDALMALGIFNYTLATLPRVVRYLSSSGAPGNPAKGIQQLELAAEKGLYLKPPAIFFLASIYSDDLKQPHKTVAILSRLREKYPESPFVDMMMIIALYNWNCRAELKVEALEFEARVARGVYSPKFWSQANFYRGLVYFKQQDWPSATERFDWAFQSASEENPFKVWALLYKGYALDAMGRRQLALQCYQEVLKVRGRWQSHPSAENRIKKPFSPNDPEINILLL